MQFLHLSVAELDAIVDAAIQRKLEELLLILCDLSPAHLPALTRLFSGCPSLTDLCLHNRTQPLIAGDGVPAFCAALRASRLRALVFAGLALWDWLPDSLAFLDALTGHPRLRNVIFDLNRAAVPDRTAIGEALGRLVAAEESQLFYLSLTECELGDEGLRPVFEALSRGSRFGSLNCEGNGVSREFARDVVLPAVRANPSLGKLEFKQPEIPELVEAEALVTVRQGKLLKK
jgi:hypothetical protein